MNGDRTRGERQFLLSAADMRQIAVGYGSCIATDRITVECHAVGYMYREAPDTAGDSGWRFFAGDETDEYANDPNNPAIYDVNTIANYSPDIVYLLSAPYGSVFEKKGRWVAGTQRTEPNE